MGTEKLFLRNNFWNGFPQSDFWKKRGSLYLTGFSLGVPFAVYAATLKKYDHCSVLLHQLMEGWGEKNRFVGLLQTIFCSSNGWTQQCPRPALHWISSPAGGKYAVSGISKEWGISLTEGKGAEEDWAINCNPVVLLFTSFLPLCFYIRTTKS